MANAVETLSQPLPLERQRDRILAAIDVGTNSLHMVVAQIRPELPAFDIVATEKEAIRLGDRDPDTGDLTPEAIARALAALRRCQDLARSLQAEQIIAVATSAVREAPNGRDFLALVQEELGLEIDLISGPEEARRIYLGVLSGMEFHRKPHVIIDIGGGSTELILGSGQDPECLTSTKVGAVRLAREFVHSDPMSVEQFSFLKAFVRGTMERAVEEVRAHLEPRQKIRLVGTSGTALALAALHAHQLRREVPSTFNGYTFSYKDLQAMLTLLRRMPYSERKNLPELNQRRAEIIVPGALILQETMQMLGAEELIICERALREGVIVDWMLTHGLIEDKLRYQGSVRRRSVLNMARRFNVDLEHAERIATFALQLFDQLHGVLHDCDQEARELLWAAALLHNCGHYINHSSHHKHSYYLIRNSNLLGYNETEIETIANLARYHRKSSPKKKHESYRSLGSKQHRRYVDLLNPILRLAVALDRRQIGAVAYLDCRWNAQQRLLTLGLVPSNSQDTCELECWSLDFNRSAFEQTYQATVLTQLHQPTAVP
jgi:exopolyphosphatase / guanosine-5'-triphosphate,3'-diphosphate pyrophosphatase